MYLINKNLYQELEKQKLLKIFCCMVALGEYKFRIANKTLRESRFYVRRPQHDLILCGVKILRRKNDHTTDEDIQQTPILTRTNNEALEYYDNNDAPITVMM
uniref:Uncharacterized protein n=1 Tax=Angiostrongylus cantonensis TaxID=6313 RepID=A0A0K0DMT8_ANGCA